MLTKTGRTILFGGALFTGSGLLFGNWPVAAAGALLLLVLSFSALGRAPRVTRTFDATHVERGARIRMTMRVEAPRGVGLVEVHQALPEEFELVEGNNLHVVTTRLFRPTAEEFHVTLRVPKRGEWTLPPVESKTLHPLGLAEAAPVAHGEPTLLVAEPRPIPARLPRDMRTRAKRPFPDGDLARMGVATNEFRELREYVPGDPPRRINWKATARRMGSGAIDVPLVNETEWEGKKSVWIVVDGHPRLSVGTNLEDAREHAADAAISIMELYLRRGYQVGLRLARSGPHEPLRPGTGEAQVKRARDLLARLAPAQEPSLVECLQRDAAVLHRHRPLVILVTRLAGHDEDLEAALRRLGAHGRQQGRNLVPGLVIDLEAPAPEGGSAERLAADAMRQTSLDLRTTARAAGLRVVGWRMDREPLQAVLVRGRIQ